jgi:hypothetical protein
VRTITTFFGSAACIRRNPPRPWFILYESALPFGLNVSESLTGNRDLVPEAILRIDD